MSVSQRSNFILIRQLLRQLRSFGLNPYDWQIDRATTAPTNTSAGVFNLCHRRDEAFKMRAQFEASQRGFARLQALRVVSL
jgi:hypothetical protein